MNAFVCCWHSISAKPKTTPLITPHITRQAASQAAAEYGRYSVFLPLFHEAHMVGQLLDAMQKLDYPPDKLELIFI